MKPAVWMAAVVAVAASVLFTGCGARGEEPAAAGAPPPAKVEHEQDVNIIKVDHPEQFALATADAYAVLPKLDATGVVSPDVSRNVPVISLASGRIVEIDAKLGDTVTKGQLLMKVQSADIAQAFSDYRQGVADENLAKAQLARAQLLYEKGAIAQKDLEVAQDTADKARITVETAVEHLRVLGADVNRPTAVVEVHAPISGVITDQQVTAAAGTQGLASPNAFTISDLTHVWIVCDVYENDLSFVRVGEYTDIHLSAYPEIPLRGRIDNIGPVLDPNIRTAKVRIDVANPGMLRLGMFVTATFYGRQKQQAALLPASAVLHLHDRDWVYLAADNNQFRRVPVDAGDIVTGNMQVLKSGIAPGQRAVLNALVLQSTVEQ